MLLAQKIKRLLPNISAFVVHYVSHTRRDTANTGMTASSICCVSANAWTNRHASVEGQWLTCMLTGVRAEPLIHPVGQGSWGAAPGSDWTNPHSRPTTVKKRKGWFYRNENNTNRKLRRGARRSIFSNTWMSRSNVPHFFSKSQTYISFEP